MQGKIQKLLEVVLDSEKAELMVLYNAMVSNMKYYKEDPTAANKRNWDAAQIGFDSIFQKLTDKYFPRNRPEEFPALKNIPAVVEYLTGTGWKIKKSAAYKHKKEGKLTAEKDGSFKVSKVDKYAARWLDRLSGFGGLDALVEGKAQAELEKLKAQARHWDIKTKIMVGEYIPRDLFDYAIAARAKIFKTDMEGFFRGRAPDIVRVCGGDPDRVPDLIEYLILQGETWLARYSAPKKWKVNLRTDLEPE